VNPLQPFHASPGSHFVGIDWGSTNARALLFKRSGELVASSDHPLGIKSIAAGGYRAAFDAMTASWRAEYGVLPALLSGMVGSRHGWREVPYLPCPVALEAISHALVPVPEVPHAAIVPGLVVAHGHHDVMRGEELQLLGLGAAAAEFAAVCLPGTHSKWVQTDGTTVHDFETAMTGEVFAAITEHTLFAQLLRDAHASTGFDEAAFRDGLRRSETAHGVLQALFECRAATLLNAIPATGLRDVLSGLLIGTEIRHARRRLPGGARIAVLGASELCARYVLALQEFGFVPRVFAARDMNARGFVAVFRANVSR
jgi:2-dehydro-3-deoxygalactonokinase